MIPEIVKQWDARKGVLEASLRTSHPDSYEELVERLVRDVLNEDPDWPDHRYGALDPSRIHVIDDGDYQGTQIYLIALTCYQPDDDDYIWFSNGYGSCSGCDTLQAISGYSSEPPDAEQVRQYMDLALHMVQRMKWLAPPDRGGAP
jgi:hypothetical protein